MKTQVTYLLQFHCYGHTAQRENDKEGERERKLTNASAMDPFSPDSTRFSTSALYLGSPPRKLSSVQRGIPNSTIQQ